MSVVVEIILALLIVFLIGYPLYKGEGAINFPEILPRRRTLAEDQEVIQNTLSEIEFDYHMKKLSDEDYQVLKNNYSSAADELLKVQKAAPSKNKPKAKQVKVDHSAIEREIEAELAALNKKSNED